MGEAAVVSDRDHANRVEASETTEREIDVAVREIVVKAFDRATAVLLARRADLDEGAPRCYARRR
jgi:cell division protease FtsH